MKNIFVLLLFFFSCAQVEQVNNTINLEVICTNGDTLSIEYDITIENGKKPYLYISPDNCIIAYAYINGYMNREVISCGVRSYKVRRIKIRK